MIAQLRQMLQRPAGVDSDPGCQPLGVAVIDGALGGGLSRGALHEIAAAGEVHLAAAAGFALAVSSRAGQKSTVWIAEDMALAESGAPYGPGLETFGLAPERLLTVAAARSRDLLWAMEEALRCRAVATAIGELRHGKIDGVAVRRLSLAAAESGALALLLRASPPNDASTAATRWIVGAAPNDSLAIELTRNRRGPLGAWTLQWSDNDGFVLATPAQPVAAPAVDRPHRKIA
jgi:protein ImuA